MVAYIRMQASQLPRVVGADAPDGRRRSDGRAGHLCHGPYLTLTPGAYAAGFFVRRENDSGGGEIDLEVTCDHGRRRLGARKVAVKDIFVSTPGLLRINFVVERVAHGCELRLWTPEGAAIELSEVVLLRTDLAERRRA